MATPMRKNYIFDPAEFEEEEEERFGAFHDGDVKIVITGTRQYHLHHNILARRSPVLARLLSEENAAELSSKAIKKGVTIRWRLDAVAPSEVDEHEYGVKFILKPIALDPTGKSIDHVPVPLDLENGMVVDPIYHAYDSVLRAIYGLPPDEDLDDVEDLPDIIRKVEHILAVAGYLEAIDTVSKPIEALLLATGQKLYAYVQSNPPGWLDFGNKIKSKPIFKEALIHAAGQYNTPMIKEAMQLGNGMNPVIYEIVQKKAQALLDAVKTVQMDMLSYYPKNMQRERKVGFTDTDQIGRNSYGNDIMSWIALTAFRQWLSVNVADDQTHHALDMGFSFLVAVAQGGNAYLDGEALKEFHNVIPMTDKGESIIGNKIFELKNHCKGFIGNLLDNYAQLTGNGQQYLTCTIVENLDYPWVSQGRQADLEDDEEDDEDMEVEEGAGEELEEAGDGDAPTSGAGLFVSP